MGPNVAAHRRSTISTHIGQDEACVSGGCWRRIAGTQYCLGAVLREGALNFGPGGFWRKAKNLGLGIRGSSRFDGKPISLYRRCSSTYPIPEVSLYPPHAVRGNEV